MAKEKLTQDKAKNSPAGGVVVGKRNGQTMVYDDASVGGYFVGKLHSEGGIKMINKSNGQPLEVQGSEVIITAPAVNDNTKRQFEGKMMTNRQILSKINSDGGGVSFADGGDIPKNIKRTGASYKYGGKTMTDHEIYKHITGGHLAEGMTLTQIAKKHKVSLKELQKQVDMGMKAESEHTSSKREQMKIVKDHLFENPEYYTLLKKVGLQNGGYFTKDEKYEIGGIFHGSPYNFDKFSTLKMGSGIGKQVDGWGIYLTDNKEATKNYDKYIYETTIFKNKSLGEYNFIDLKKPVKKDIVTKILKAVYKKFNNDFDINKFNQYYDYIKDKSLPKVDFNDYELVEFDYAGYLFYKTLSRILGGDKNASLFLLDNGIDGLKASFENSKGVYRTDYVIFDENAITIESKELLSNNYYKKGGEVENLVKDAKSGNSPSRDLNNYNDLLDLQADGMVGGNTGLFARGGATDVVINNWNDIPDDFKKIRLPKKIDWLDIPSDDGLNEIVKPFLGTNQYRKAQTGINFDDNGITVTDSHALLTIPSFNNNYKGIFKKTKTGVEIINETYPQYERVIPNEKEITNVFYIDILKLLTYCKVAKNYSGQREIVFKINNDFMAFFPDLMINFLSSLIKLTGNTLWNVSFNKTNEQALLFTKYPSYELGKDIIGLIMPFSGQVYQYGTRNPDKNADLNVFFDFDNNEIVNLDGSTVNLDVKPTRQKAKKTTAKTTASQTSVPITPDADSVILIEVIDEQKSYLGLAENIYELLEILQKYQNNGGYRFYVKYKFKDKDIYEAEYIRWIENSPSVLGDINPSATSPTELKEWLRKFKDLKEEPFNLDYFFSKSISATASVNASVSASVTPTATATTTSLPIDLKHKKIFIGDNPALSEKVQKKAFELGWFWETTSNSVRRTNDKALFFFNDKSILSGSEETFNDTGLEEITEADLFGTATTTSIPFDLSKTKIWIGNNPVLSEKIQKRVMELGWDWWSGNKTPKFLDYTNLFFDEINKKITSGGDRTHFDSFKDYREITEADLFGTTSSRTSTQNAPVEDEDWVKKFTADLDKLATYLPNDMDFAPELSKERKDLNALIQLLPSFQQSKYAIERAKILKEIKKLHYKLTYEGFIKPNEATSSDADLFTPQGLLDYYFTQATQNPTAELEEGCGLPTPNGKNSKLPMSAYLNVRTPQFKNWFGDWEKAYENGNYVNCSKMIDPDTKEPKIYFHGVRKYVPNFGQFSNMGQGVVRPYGAFEPPTFPASYFAGEEDYAKFYGGVAENLPTPSADYKPFIYKVFLSVKNPISLLPLDFMLSYKDFMDYIYVAYGVKVEPNQELLKLIDNDLIKKHPMWFYVRRDIGFIEKIKDYGYDALFQMGDIPTFLPDGTVEPDRTKHLQEVEYLTFYPNQVKSATVKKSFYFDFFNDIRFKNGGYVRI